MNQLRFIAIERFAVIKLLIGCRRKGDAADLGQHDRHLYFPREGHAETGRQIRRVSLEAHGTPEGQGVGERENFGERLDASAQRLFQQLPFGRDQPMLVDRGLNGGKKALGIAGLGQESKDLSVVDCRDG